MMFKVSPQIIQPGGGQDGTDGTAMMQVLRQCRTQESHGGEAGGMTASLHPRRYGGPRNRLIEQRRDLQVVGKI